MRKEVYNKLFVSALALTLLAAGCRQRPGGNEKEKAHQTHRHAHEHQGKMDTGLVLNNGERWITDNSTRRGMGRIEQIVERFGRLKTSPDIQEYRMLGENIQKEVDSIISACSMKGKGHEILHR